MANEKLNQNQVIDENDLDKVSGGRFDLDIPFEGIPQTKPAEGFF